MLSGLPNIQSFPLSSDVYKLEILRGDGSNMTLTFESGQTQRQSRTLQQRPPFLSAIMITTDYNRVADVSLPHEV